MIENLPRILHVMAGAAHGGAETFFVDSITALHEAGYKQSVITRANNPVRLETIRSMDIPVATASFSSWWKFPTASILKKTIATFKPDIIQYAMGRAGTYALPVCPARQIGWYGGYYKVSRFKHCDFHVAVTKDIADNIVKQEISPERVSVLHTYADFPAAKPVSRASLSTPDDAILILALARLHQKKGLDILLRALTNVPEAYLWIAGDGPLESDLKQLCTSLGLDNRVRFLGWRNDRYDLLATADICAFPSRYEPFGTVTVEAWSMKTPLVAARSAGPKAYITHEENGLLVDIDDVDGLASSLNRLIKNPPLRETLIENGFQAWKEGFSKEAFTKNARAFYEKVVNGA